MPVCDNVCAIPFQPFTVVMGLPMADQQPDLDRWTQHGLITEEQRARILEFERSRREQLSAGGPGRLANAISTVGAGVAIFATAGIVALFAGDWSSTEAMLAAVVAALIMIAAAWQLVRNGWGAPAGLLVVCGLVLIPVALRQATEAFGWWPEDDFRRRWQELERERERIIGVVLLISILPGMLTTRLGLRQAWMLLPIALWFGAVLLVESPFDNTAVAIAQVAFGAAVAAIAAFLWRPDERGRGTTWWLQIGGLLLAAQAAGSATAFGVGPGYAAAAAAAALGIFIVGVTTSRTPWMVAGALGAVLPIGSLIFEYFEGLAGLIVVAIVGLTVTFLPLIRLRRRARAPRV
jgi:hypothetical protein